MSATNSLHLPRRSVISAVLLIFVAIMMGGVLVLLAVLYGGQQTANAAAAERDMRIKTLEANSSNQAKLLEESRKQFEKCSKTPKASGCETPVVPPQPNVTTQPAPGPQGVSIANVLCQSDGRWLVLLTNGQQSVTGNCLGRPGRAATGSPGKNGSPGADSTVPGPQGSTGPSGASGAPGQNGTNGTNGADGVSVESVECTDSGRLLVKLTGADPVDVGQCLGAAGPSGPPGASGASGAPGADSTVQGPSGPPGPTGPGRGISTITCTGDGLIVVYTDGETANAGQCRGADGSPGADSTVPGPSGPPGPSGAPGESVTVTPSP